MMEENEAVVIPEADKESEENGIDELIRREADRLMDGRERKLEREIRAKLKEERINAVREAEAKKDAEIDSLRHALAESEDRRIMRECELECSVKLGEAGLPLSLAPFAVDRDSEKMAAKIALLRAAVNETARREIESRIATVAPDVGVRSPLPREAIVRMSLAELQDAMK